MYKLSKIYPGGKQVIKDISLSFLPGAKIGVLGGNGAGKSTLLKIMAGVETEYNGEAKLADGIKVGYLAQEPELKSNLKETSLYRLFDYEVKGIGEIVADCHYDDGESIAIRVGVTLTKPSLLSFMFPAGMDTIIYPPDKQQ